MIDNFDQIWRRASGAFADPRSQARARKMALSALTCLGRRTISNFICTAGQQFVDWSADYRLFARERFDCDKLMRAVLEEVCAQTPVDQPIVIAMDDSNFPKKGKKVHGAKWRPDRMGPKFSTNFIWAQRWLQFSAIVPDHSGAAQARAIPVSLLLARVLEKPKPGAKDYEQTKKAARENAMPALAVKQMKAIAAYVQSIAPGRVIIFCGDGGYTNKTVLRDLPAGSVFIGRIRKDASFFAPASQQHGGKGRKTVYGGQLPTLDQLRQNGSEPWHSVSVHAGGHMREFDVKTMQPVRWKNCGPADLKAMVIRPTSYKTSKNGKTLYREPAYLVSSDPDISDQQMLQAYVWRWEIEVNFRDEKKIIGVAEAHVRTKASVEHLTTLLVAAYAMLHLACRTNNGKSTLPSPKWYPDSQQKRLSTNQAIQMLRADMWSTALGLSNFTGFAQDPPTRTKPLKFTTAFQSAVLSASRC